MANNSNTKIVNGYAFKIGADGKLSTDMKANLKNIPNLTDTTKRVAMGMVNTKEGLSL